MANKVKANKVNEELRNYVKSAPQLTVDDLAKYYEFWHRSLVNSDGTPVRCRRNGKLKTWKTRPGCFQLPVKYGLRECFYLTPDNIADWCLKQ